MRTMQAWLESSHARSDLGTEAAIPTAPDEDGIPVERQRAERLGPEFDPDYFAKLDRLIEENTD
ncbi:hypothetical protein OIU34_16890 [Pararhizobium sp. BT-229]|uniref:hypothetical protein n=1 Tax=Pararhizobium sp. BT-229 TaxID=2986923 RepID=UPI0021F760CF|nr:hypothetical protein [Pararhizobium sp. BT-229]MCV9963582.1 hypothetical protein [Pararhizobium sp. BT-229]